MKTGVIDVGGGLRGIYGAGVLDYCLDKNIHFDYCIGVSAGGANLISFLAGQKERNRIFYLDYSFRKEYMSFKNLLKVGSYVNLDYGYTVLSNTGGECPLDYPALCANPAEFIIVASEALSGKTKYFEKCDLKQDNYDVLKASAALPVVGKPYVVDGIPYFDGGLNDPVPIEKAFADGCDKVIVILTRPKDFVRSPKKDERRAKLLRRKYPRTAENLRQRAQRYNEEIAMAKAYEEAGKALVIAPDDIAGLDTLTKDKTILEQLYNKGYHDAFKIPDFLGLV
jgi:predicted patatin/cPLA2 family phospholipase